MAKYKKKPVVIEAEQWFKNGDHSQDDCEILIDSAGESYLSEGQVVRYYRNPELPDSCLCHYCNRDMNCHGWIDTLEGGHIVCPGDYVITGIKNEKYPCKPDVFILTYESIIDDSSSMKCNHCDRQDETVRKYVGLDKPIEMTYTNTPDYMCDTCYFGGAVFPSEYYREVA